MRWASLTPSMTWKTARSKSYLPPTPPSTVWITPVERCTSNSRSTSRSITCSICSSVAPSCMTTTIGFLRGLLHHAQTLYGAAGVDDALEDAAHGLSGQRAVVGAGDIGEHQIFAFGFVDGEVRLEFHAADILHHLGALVEQGDDAAVHIVDQEAVLLELGLGLGFGFFGGHAMAPNPLLSSRVKASSRVSNAGLSALRSIRCTNALPTTTASTSRPSSATCAGLEMPKPTASGRLVVARTA